jgi:hypothetical protein
MAGDATAAARAANAASGAREERTMVFAYTVDPH